MKRFSPSLKEIEDALFAILINDMELGSNFQNLDLLSVGVATAGMLILGFVTFLNNAKSFSNRIFLCLAVVASVWGIINYLSYQITITDASFWLLRFVMFLAVWAAFFVFTFSYIFPSEKNILPLSFRQTLIPITVFVSILTLTPWVFNSVAEVTREGHISSVVNGPGIFAFGGLVAFLNIGGIVLLVRKIMGAEKGQRRPLQFVLFGFILMLLLIMIFNFLYPAFLSNSRFIPLGALFMFPFIVLTSYAMLRHHFLNVKIIATEILAFFLSIAVLYEVIFSENLTIRFLRVGIFSLVLGLSILLIRSVRREVEQREKLQKLTEELEAANAKLKAADQLKSEFLSFASHQVKSPMAVVKGYAQLIADGTYGRVSAETKETAAKIKQSADRLIALVNNLLDMRKIEEGKMDFNFGQVDISGLVRSMTDEYKMIGKSRELDVSYSGIEGELLIKADEQKVRQVIQNVIDNAIKYTDKGFVHVDLKNEDINVLITVSDSGRGISKGLQEKLFGQFVRDEKTKLEIQGTGLGLFIAKEIVEAHRGQIWVESEGEGKGSQFYVRLSKNVA